MVAAGFESENAEVTMNAENKMDLDIKAAEKNITVD